jgi:hypothetical protein
MDLLEVTIDLPRHTVREIEDRVIVADIDAPDEPALKAGFVGDCANDVTRGDTVVSADLDPVVDHLDPALASLAPLSRFLAESLATQRTLARSRAVPRIGLSPRLLASQPRLLVHITLAP